MLLALIHCQPEAGPPLAETTLAMKSILTEGSPPINRCVMAKVG